MKAVKQDHSESRYVRRSGRVLHIDSSARLHGSNSRILGQYLVAQLRQPVTYRDLAAHPLAPISAEDLMGVHGSSDAQRPSLLGQLAVSNGLIEELRSADTLVLGVAMHNFGIPVVLKQWIDAICRAGVSFRYTEQGPVGLLGVSQAYIITSSGGTPIGSEADFASRYLEHVCRFVGVRRVHHIDASGSKRTADQVIARGKAQIDAALADRELASTAQQHTSLAL
ncbi:MAG: NAD(P)H-dependent oxidoreductase [Halioglobus sp.]